MASDQEHDEPEDDLEDEHEHGDVDSCCPMRRKVVVGIIKVMTEEECGIPDAELADAMRFDLQTPDGKAVLAFRFCPWCGTPRDPGTETRIVDVNFGPFQDPDPEPDPPF